MESRFAGDQIVRTAADARALFGPHFENVTTERLLVAYVDCERRVLGLRVLHGMATGVALPIRLVIAQALGLDAAGIIIAHCHPSGDPRPSAEDIAATRRLTEAARPLALQVHDHLIFVDGNCISFAAAGLV